MTAIAYANGIMAADSLVTGRDTVRGTTAKIARSPKGTIAAAAGQMGVAALFRRMVETGRIDDWLADGAGSALPVKSEGYSFGAIIVQRDGTVTCIDSDGNAVPNLAAVFYVEGSAAEILIGAMAARADPVTAVEIAIHYDLSSGGPVQVEALDEFHGESPLVAPASNVLEVGPEEYAHFEACMNNPQGPTPTLSKGAELLLKGERASAGARRRQLRLR